MIDQKLEQYFNSMKELWNNANFQILISELNEQMESIDSVERTATVEDLYFRKGQVNVIRTLQNLSDNIDMLESDYKQGQESPLGADGDVFL